MDNTQTENKDNYADLWAFILFICTYIYLYRSGFSQISFVNLNYEKAFHFAMLYFLTFALSLSISVIFISFLSKYAEPTAITFHIVLPSVMVAYEGFVGKFFQKLINNDSIQNVITPCLVTVIILSLIVHYLIFVRPYLTYTKILINNIAKTYQSNIQSILNLYIVMTFKIYVLIFITFEIVQKLDRSNLDDILFIIFDIWSLIALMMSIRVITNLLATYKIGDNTKFKIPADKVLLSIGKIYFAAFFYPTTYVSRFLKRATIKTNSNEAIIFVKKAYNIFVIILETLTFGIINKHQEFALNSAVTFKMSYLNGIIESDKLFLNPVADVLNKSNVLWRVFLPAYFVFVRYGYIFVKSYMHLSSYANVAQYAFFAFFIVSVEFVYSSCGAILFQYLVNNDAFKSSNNELHDFFSNYSLDENIENVKNDEKTFALTALINNEEVFA
ncbi:hypothetical protein COBT_001489 [Conglomerata obtusa]